MTVPILILVAYLVIGCFLVYILWKNELVAIVSANDSDGIIPPILLWPVYTMLIGICLLAYLLTEDKETRKRRKMKKVKKK